jgi:hypothetical protein
MKRVAAIALGLVAMLATARAADDTFDVSTYEKKAFEWKGYLEVRPERQWLSRDSVGYRLAYPGEDRSTADRVASAAEISGILRHESLSFNFTGHAAWLNEPHGNDHDERMYEAYGAWQIDPNSNVEVGKRALRWGKGYAWSPVAFLERPKDPLDPELAREGFGMATASYVRSLDSILQTVALTAVVLPVTDSLNTDFAPGSNGNHVNPALKLYGLILDTDVDLIWAGSGSRGTRYGFDFSRNVGTNLEIHGEWAHSSDVPRAVLTGAGSLAVQTRDVSSALIGLRHLTDRETTIIFELYRNGAGYTSEELDVFYRTVRSSASTPSLSTLARQAALQGYNRPNVGRHYAYVRVSQKEPFDILDFTPAFTAIVNTDDRSFSLVPEAIYAGIRNVELRLRAAFNSGDPSTEFGEKAVSRRLELRARVFF